LAQIEAWRHKDKWAARQIAVELQRSGHQVSLATVTRSLVRLGVSRWAEVDPAGSTTAPPPASRPATPATSSTWM
jgi:arginine repressor